MVYSPVFSVSQLRSIVDHVPQTCHGLFLGRGIVLVKDNFNNQVHLTQSDTECREEVDAHFLMPSPRERDKCFGVFASDG